MKRLILIGAVLGAFACESKATAPAVEAKAEVAPVAKTEAAPVAKTEAAAEVEEIPVEADFEEEADKQIDASNYKAELEAIATAIDQE